MTYNEVLERMENFCYNVDLASVALGRMMDIVEEETGVFPDWDDKAPDWIIKNVFG